jgi:hypothetical protein
MAIGAFAISEVATPIEQSSKRACSIADSSKPDPWLLFGYYAEDLQGPKFK